MIWHAELERPQFRAVEPIPAMHGDERVVLFRDPLGIAAEGLAVPYHVYFLVAHMTGEHTVRELADLFQRQFDAEIPLGQLQELIMQFDEGRLLETELYRTRHAEMLREYRAAPLRPVVHLRGIEPDRLRAALDANFTAEGGPGRKPEAGTAEGPRVIVAPHIDFERGGPNYGWSYQALGDGAPPETVVILGVSHAPCRQPFALTRKGFDTPLGPVEAEIEFIDALAGKCSSDLREDELNHTAEHSVEFQVAWLRHIFPDAPEMRIVPILCGPMASDEDDAWGQVGVDLTRAVEALVETVREWPRRVTVIAGADLAHVGPHFGDEDPVSDDRLREIEALDREALNLAEAGDAEGFVRSFEPTGNTRRVCSVSCIYAALRCLPALGVERGRLLSYVQSLHESRELCVTHASLRFP